MPRPTKLAVAVALNLLSRAAQATEVQRAPAGVQPRDASKSRVWGYHGVVFGGGEWGAEGVALGSGGANASLQAAVAEAGVSTIRLIPTWFVDNINTTAIYRNEVRWWWPAAGSPWTNGLAGAPVRAALLHVPPRSPRGHEHAPCRPVGWVQPLSRAFFPPIFSILRLPAAALAVLVHWLWG